MMVWNNERGRLQLMNERVCLGEVPVGIRLIPHSIEPDATNGSVICKQFTQLSIHVVVEVQVPIATVRAAVVPGRGPSRIVVGIVPIQLRVVKEKLDSLAV